ncbi:MAG: hypothetical protein NTW21_04995 [Verrucomicrobia bacterium]|nr:hypothetical protein [Verrucomicrobiota bacterium]
MDPIPADIVLLIKSIRNPKTIKSDESPANTPGINGKTYLSTRKTLEIKDSYGEHFAIGVSVYSVIEYKDREFSTSPYKYDETVTENRLIYEATYHLSGNHFLPFARELMMNNKVSFDKVTCVSESYSNGTYMLQRGALQGEIGIVRDKSEWMRVNELETTFASDEVKYDFPTGPDCLERLSMEKTRLLEGL